MFKVQIVEDERLVALDLQCRIEQLGYEVVAVASTAATAVKEALEKHPDLILMDIKLAGSRDGIDAALDIKQHMEVPIVFLTAYTDTQMIQRAKAVNPISFLIKPYKIRDLYTTIELASHKVAIESRIREYDSFYLSMLNSLTVGLVAFDTDLYVRVVNPTAQRLLNIPEVVDRTIRIDSLIRAFDEQSHAALNLPYEQVIDGHSYDFEGVYFATHHNGQLSIDGSILPMRSDETVTGGALSFRDVTNYKRMSRVIKYQASHDSLTGLENREELSRISIATSTVRRNR